MTTRRQWHTALPTPTTPTDGPRQHSILELTNGYDWNAGGANLDLTQVKSFLFSGFVGSDNGGAKIDQFELYTTGDPETALGPCPGTMLVDFEGYADTAAAEADGWFTSQGDGGGAGMGVEAIDGNSVLSIGWNHFWLGGDRPKSGSAARLVQL